MNANERQDSKLLFNEVRNIELLPPQWPQGGLCISLLMVEQHPDPA